MNEIAKEFERILETMTDSKGNSIPNVMYLMLPDDWRALASKPDKTKQDMKRLDEQYQKTVIALAQIFLNYIGGSADNVASISKKDFINYFVSKNQRVFARRNDLDVSQISAGLSQKFNNEAEIALRRLTRGKETEVLTVKDYAAFIYSLDWGTMGEDKNKLNGKISSRDYAINAALLVQDVEENLLDLKLKYAYKNLFGEE